MCVRAHVCVCVSDSPQIYPRQKPAAQNGRSANLS